MRYPEIKQLSALTAYKSDGSSTIQPKLVAGSGPGFTLTAGNWLIPLGGERYGSVVETVVNALSAVWPAGIVGSCTIEATNFPKTTSSSDQGAADITDWDIVSNAWQKINPALVGMVYATATGTGVMTAMTCAITAGAGGAYWNVPDFGALRLRANLNLTTGGFCRFMGHAKLGS